MASSLLARRFSCRLSPFKASRGWLGLSGSNRSFVASSRTIIKEANEWEPKTFAVIETSKDEVGTLRNILDTFEQHHVSLTHIESSFHHFARTGPSFHVDFISVGKPDSDKTAQLVKNINATPGVVKCTMHPCREVSWFPLNIRDLDLTRETLDGGTDLISNDHPGFNDEVYKQRRTDIVQIAHTYTHGMEIPRIKYTEQETETWGIVYKRLQECHKRWACSHFNKVFPELESYCGYAPNNIPQLEDISDYLQQKTGFSLRPVSGLLSARDFLNALAFRVFFSTQYIRHHGNPLYTPEPDICHELLGHVPLFADMDFADFSQQIGLASLAATDEDIDRLASVYWFTVEFGLLKEDGEVKAFGAGLLSSFGEMEWSCADEPSEECRKMGSMVDLTKPQVVPFDTSVASSLAYPITTYQPTYFCAEDMNDVKTRVQDFCDSLPRPFFPQYDSLTKSIRVTKAVSRLPRVSLVSAQAEKQAAFFANKEAVDAASAAAAAGYGSNARM